MRVRKHRHLCALRCSNLANVQQLIQRCFEQLRGRAGLGQTLGHVDHRGAVPELLERMRLLVHSALSLSLCGRLTVLRRCHLSKRRDSRIN